MFRFVSKPVFASGFLQSFVVMSPEGTISHSSIVAGVGNLSTGLLATDLWDCVNFRSGIKNEF